MNFEIDTELPKELIDELVPYFSATREYHHSESIKIGDIDPGLPEKEQHQQYYQLKFEKLDKLKNWLNKLKGHFPKPKYDRKVIFSILDHSIDDYCRKECIMIQWKISFFLKQK